jgi:hypothetical protein
MKVAPHHRNSRNARTVHASRLREMSAAVRGTCSADMRAGGDATIGTETPRDRCSSLREVSNLIGGGLLVGASARIALVVFAVIGTKEDDHD